MWRNVRYIRTHFIFSLQIKIDSATNWYSFGRKSAKLHLKSAKSHRCWGILFSKMSPVDWMDSSKKQLIMDNIFYFKIRRCLCLHFWGYHPLTRRKKIDKRTVDKIISFAFVKHSFSQNLWRILICSPHISVGSSASLGSQPFGHKPRHLRTNLREFDAPKLNWKNGKNGVLRQHDLNMKLPNWNWYFN